MYCIEMMDVKQKEIDEKENPHQDNEEEDDSIPIGLISSAILTEKSSNTTGAL